MLSKSNKGFKFLSVLKRLVTIKSIIPDEFIHRKHELFSEEKAKKHGWSLSFKCHKTHKALPFNSNIKTVYARYGSA